MTREFTCIICPNGCEISADYEIQADQSVVIRSLEGATCKRGAEYVKQELTDPKRNIATSVLVEGGELPLASVRLTAPIPKARISMQWMRSKMPPESACESRYRCDQGNSRSGCRRDRDQECGQGINSGRYITCSVMQE